MSSPFRMLLFTCFCRYPLCSESPGLEQKSGCGWKLSCLIDLQLTVVKTDFLQKYSCSPIETGNETSVASGNCYPDRRAVISRQNRLFAVSADIGSVIPSLKGLFYAFSANKGSYVRKLFQIGPFVTISVPCVRDPGMLKKVNATPVGNAVKSLRIYRNSTPNDSIIHRSESFSE
ncbi:hypothetical protein PAE9249_01036 [Paenibacillus sp. CECT 9249]|nr:hypothetical protein PAE9249_01036 [Paenibacillus sp. CECT 9249]